MSENAPQTSNHSARRINKIAEALEAMRYIEIGVSSGTTFHSIKVRDRVAVDPAFRFDTTPFCNSNTTFFPVKSDAYFSSISPKILFDIYFIDGFHTFEQTLRDFSNAIMHSHSKTVWLIDDTKPNDVFSSIPDWQEAFRFRELNGSHDKSWHGDVYKLIFYIHDFCPGLNYRTIVGSGNPQTLVWMSKSSSRAPRFNNLEAISRLTYFDLCNNLEVLRECGEDEAITMCLNEIRQDQGD